MRATIPALASTSLNEVARHFCELEEGNFAVGFDSGSLHVYGSDGVIISTVELQEKIIGLANSDGNIIAATSTGGVRAFQGKPIWEYDIESGCEMICSHPSGVLVADSSDRLLLVSSQGSLLQSIECKSPMAITCSENGFCAAALEDGTILILNASLEVIHESMAAADDVETVSCMEFRSDDVLMVARNSLGVVVDDRPENRIECWHPERGLLNTTEVFSRVTCMLPTDYGVLAGCFDGSLLKMEIGSNDPETISQFEYQVSCITIWGDDLLVASWFDVFRVSNDRLIIWQFEHPGIVDSILPLGERVALIGDDRKSGSIPSPIVIIDPDTPASEDHISYNYTDESEEFSGSLSPEEEALAESRPEPNLESDQILQDLNEEDEKEPEEAEIEPDILRELSASARSINLPPVADTGEDITVESDHEGKAEVLLDGSSSYDPDGDIESWAWEDERQRVIGNSDRIRVKIAKGVHVFYLTVTDDKGSATRSSITVHVK